MNLYELAQLVLKDGITPTELQEMRERRAAKARKVITLDQAFTWWEWKKRWIKANDEGRRWIDLDGENWWEITAFGDFCSYLKRIKRVIII